MKVAIRPGKATKGPGKSVSGPTKRLKDPCSCDSAVIPDMIGISSN